MLNHSASHTPGLLPSVAHSASKTRQGKKIRTTCIYYQHCANLVEKFCCLSSYFVIITVRLMSFCLYRNIVVAGDLFSYNG